MDKHWDESYLAVALDLAGCPNRCRHCWLGERRGGGLDTRDFIRIAGQFRDWRDETGRGIEKLAFFSWWREPDFRADYRDLWELEQQLSTPGCAERFELLSTWRLARDGGYAAWAAGLQAKTSQITFFGLEENTDWFMRRKGAFSDQLAATERLLAAGITPRWQLFVTKRCLNELDDFLQLIQSLQLSRRCAKAGSAFTLFLGGMSPEGNGYAIEDLRLEEEDLARIPPAMTQMCREGTLALGLPEYRLLPELLCDPNPPRTSPGKPCIYIDAACDAYPNIAEPASWWRLGNLDTDGVDAILKAYRDGTTPGMIANRTIPVRVLAKRFGENDGKKLYTRGDLVCRFMHQWGAAQTVTGA